MNASYGFQNLLKEGHKHFSGLEEAILKNIKACQEISKVTKTSLGPNGMKKMVINHLDKIFVTSDAATIMRELEVQHPAAKIIVMASKMQEGECGDGTNFVISLAGELLNQAEVLIKMGLHPSQILTGYELASKKACDLLEEAVCYKVEDVSNKEQVIKGMYSSICAKVPGFVDFLVDLISQACLYSLPRQNNLFNVESVRVCKILGSNVTESSIIQGIVVHRQAEGMITSVTNPVIAAYSIPLDPQQSDTKGTVLLKNAEEMLSYTKSEEELAEKIVKNIADAGINLIIAGGAVSDIMLHYIEKYKIMCVRILSKFELKRLCAALGCNALASLDVPTKEEQGSCDRCYVNEIGSDIVTIFQKNSEDCKINTIVLRGSTNNLLDDLERAVEDGVNNFRNMIINPNYVPGAGSIETMLQSKLEQEAKKLTDLNQYAYNKFAQSFQIISRILSDNAGLNTNEILSEITVQNNTGIILYIEPSGIDMNNEKISKISDIQVYDHMRTKWWGIKLATDAALTILKVDQIIIAKQSGGPKPPSQAGWDNDD